VAIITPDAVKASQDHPPEQVIRSLLPARFDRLMG
jgi:hypothetical protein